MRPPSRDAGFTLAEVCVAMLLLVVTATGGARLMSLAVIAAQSARLQTTTTVMASQKIEALRALVWPDAALHETPSGALDSNTAGCVEFLDSRGQLAGTGAVAPPAARFIRRWSIEALPADPANSIVLQVLVTTVESDRGARRPRARMAGDAIVVTILSRQGR
jgi:hypothetical protein